VIDRPIIATARMARSIFAALSLKRSPKSSWPGPGFVAPKDTA